jgi:hypothetical protein
MHSTLARKLVVFTAVTIAAIGLASAREASYAVTVTNLTASQIISPPLVVVHDASVTLFEAGEAASEPLRYLAEDGMNGPFLDVLPETEGVHAFSSASGPLLPGRSVTVEVGGSSGPAVISAIGMLVTTNDAFFAASSIPTPNYRFAGLDVASFLASTYAKAWDAGTEANSEACDDIPGPPCGNPGVRNTEDAEGFVHIHRGIAGGADLDPSVHDWRNPVARVTVERLR